MKTKKRMQRFLSIFLACIMIMNVPMSALAFEDVQIMDVIAEEAVEMAAEENCTVSSEEAIIVSEETVIEEVTGENAEADGMGAAATQEESNLDAEALNTAEEYSLGEDTGIQIMCVEESVDPLYASGDVETVAEAGNKLDTSNLTFDVTEPAGYVTISFTDNGVRPEDAAIENVELYGTAVGTIIGATRVPFETGDNMADVTVRLFNAMGLSYECTGTPANGFYLASLKDFELNGTYYDTFGEFDAGAQSGWCVRLNNWHINEGCSAFTVEDGDVISWLYSCQWGNDVGADFENHKAEISSVVLQDSSLTLVEGEDGNYTCAVPEDISSIAFEVVPENYASVITVTVDGETVKYRPNEAIAVKNNSCIVISTKLTYTDTATNEDKTYTDSVTIQLSYDGPVNTAPNIKAEYAEAKGKTYIYSTSYVYIYMEDIFEDADGDELTYKATLDGEEVEITYNSYSKQNYIQFAAKPAVREYKIWANDGKADSEVFTAKCVGTSAAITAAEGQKLIPNGTYYYYVMGSQENDVLALDYTLDVDETINTEWVSSNTNALTANGDGTFTVNPELTARTSLYVGVTAGVDGWGYTLYLGTKNLYILPGEPKVADITAELAEHADKQSATVVSSAFTGWYSSEFDYEIEDPSICSLTTSGTYGLSIVPKNLGTTKVTAKFKYDESIQCSFNVTVTGHSIQIAGQPGVDSVTYEEGKTLQMEVLGAAEGETFTWSSADETVATIDEKGLVTVQGLGQTYITAVSSLSTEETPIKASMYLQVKEDGKVYLEDIAVTDYTYFDGFISAKSAFNSAQLTYDWSLAENRYTYNKLAFTPYFDDENLDAVLNYQVSGGEYQTMDLADGTAVSIANGLNPGENVVKIDVYPTDDPENITTYTFNIFRPYNPSNTITRMVIYPNGETALSYPTYLNNKEGTIFQWNKETGEFINGWNGSPSTSWSSTVYNYKTYVYGKRTASVSVYPTFAYAGQRVMIYVDGEPMEEAVTNWKSTLIPVDSEKGTTITFHVNSEKYHAEKLAAGVEDPFAEPENIYTIHVESVEPLGIDAQILSAEIEGGKFYRPGFTSTSYTISALIPSGETTADLKFTVPSGIDVYKTSVTDANKLEPDGQDEDGNNTYTTPIVTITGTGVSSYSTTKIILQVTDEEGNTGKTEYAFTVLQRGEKDVYPDSIVDYLCIGSQYTNASSYGTMPERTLKNTGGVLSLGNFGGYIVYKYDTPIENNPNNPYGVDFVAYGNSFGSGGHEPGYVQVSQDGKTWYTLAGSEHYDDHNDWDYTMTYTNNNGLSSWTNSDGESGQNYNYPKASAYPYFNWTEELEQSMTVSGYRLNSSAKDAYGSAAAVLPVFGYVDVNTNGTINGTSNNPYNHPGTLVAGGDQFDIDWAVDENGMPVKLDSISYIRIATASSIYAGAIGEKSTEVTTVNRVTNTAASAVGETAAPAAIFVNGAKVQVPANGGTLNVDYSPNYMAGGTTSEFALTVDVSAGEEANIYINNTSGETRSYSTVPEKGIIRVIVQEGEMEPYICYLILNETDPSTVEIGICTGILAELPSVEDLTVADKEKVEAARAAYEALTKEQQNLISEDLLKLLKDAEEKMEELTHVCSWDEGTVTKAATCTATGIKTYKCSCGETKTETIPAAGHKYGSWIVVSEATVSAAEVQKRTCSVCGASETRSVGKALTPVLEVPGKLSSFNIKKGKTVKFALTMANGDSISSVSSSKTGYLKVSAVDKKAGTITLKGVKKGTSELTVKLASGKTRTYTVKVVTGTVKTTSLNVINPSSKKLTLAVKGTYTLKSEVKPFTSTQKITYKSSNRKIVKVTSSGKITAVAPGKATITIASGSKKEKVVVTVAGITNVKSSVTVKKNKTLTLKPKVYGISGGVTYTSSNTAVATVAANGKIKGIKKGTANITIKAGNVTKTVKVKVK